MANIMFPHAWDSTMIGSFRACPQKMFRQYIQHWKPKAESVHLVAGGAFAKGLEVARKAYFCGVVPTYREEVDPETGIRKMVKDGEVECDKGDAAFSEGAGLHSLLIAYGDFECPSDSAKSIERTAGALEYYFSQYPLGACGMTPISLPDGNRGIEFSFAEPLDVRHPVTGDPILYTGRADMIAEFAGGVYIEDDKTTSALGASWPRQWELRSQFTGYSWAAKQAGIHTDGAIVRGVSILKTKYDTLQAITYRSEREVNRWYDQVNRDIERCIAMWKEGRYDYNLDHACAEFGGCSFVQICKSADPETWLKMYFEKRVWDPLARKETTVEEWEASWGHDPKSAGIILP